MCIQLWCPYLAKEFDTLETMQVRATKLVKGLERLPYTARLQKLGFNIYIHCLRVCGDLIETYKILKDYYDNKWSQLFTVNLSSTRGHCLKLFKKQSRTTLRQGAFHATCYQCLECST